MEFRNAGVLAGALFLSASMYTAQADDGANASLDILQKGAVDAVCDPLAGCHQAGVETAGNDPEHRLCADVPRRRRNRSARRHAG